MYTYYTRDLPKIRPFWAKNDLNNKKLETQSSSCDIFHCKALPQLNFFSNSALVRFVFSRMLDI